MWVRVLAGGLIVLGLVLALWGPLFIFSGAFPNSEADKVTLSSAALNLYFSDSNQNTVSTQLWSFPNMLNVEDAHNCSSSASSTVSSRYPPGATALPTQLPCDTIALLTQLRVCAPNADAGTRSSASGYLRILPPIGIQLNHR